MLIENNIPQAWDQTPSEPDTATDCSPGNSSFVAQKALMHCDIS
jgi:hypothetical protein